MSGSAGGAGLLGSWRAVAIEHLGRLDGADRALLTFAVGVVPVAALARQPYRAGLALLLVGVVPGLAAVRALQIRDAHVALLSAVAVSLGMATLVSMGLFYVRLWSWPLTGLVLGLLTAALVLARPVLAGPQESPPQPPAPVRRRR